jgi:hypothetical protein
LIFQFVTSEAVDHEVVIQLRKRAMAKLARAGFYHRPIRLTSAAMIFEQSRDPIVSDCPFARTALPCFRPDSPEDSLFLPRCGHGPRSPWVRGRQQWGDCQ